MTYSPLSRDAAPAQLDYVEHRPVAKTVAAEHDGAAVGLRARRAFLELRLWRRTLHPVQERFYWYFLKPICALAIIVWFTVQYSRAFKRECGIGIGKQIAAQCRLGFVDWVNPRGYYFFEHFRLTGPIDVDAYVMRHEIKHGLMKALHKMRPVVHGRRIDLGHKLDFATTCVKFGIPTPAILAYAKDGRIQEGFSGLENCSTDIFVKREQGRGAIGARAYHRTDKGLYRRGKHAVTENELIAAIARSSRSHPLIVQPLLRNHAEIRDLAGGALMSFRVFTCIDQSGNPQVTHAMLRSLSKLEPDWNTGEEFAAPVDLMTGRLGLMCGDSNVLPDAWHRNHPVTGAPVAGRIIRQWPAIRDLALAAHQVFRDRIIVGWDIALTPDGPTVLEGNSYPDTEFLQRVHRQPIGRSPLGPLLQHHLDILIARRGGFRAEINAAP